MYGPLGDITGVRMRGTDGSKWSLKGGRNGLFMTGCMSKATPLYIVEGPTDLAALLSMRLYGIGRPDCSPYTNLVTQHMKATGCQVAVMVADADRPGRAGALRLSQELEFPSRVIAPVDHKDARDYYREIGEQRYLVDAVHGSDNRYWRRIDN
jgi:hypothetical protein